MAFVARFIVHTILLLPSLYLYVMGGVIVALIIGLIRVGHYRDDGADFAFILFYPLTLWYSSVFSG